MVARMNSWQWSISLIIDNSSLHIRDYLFRDGSRKYSFHWQDFQGQLIQRWDNSTHHHHIATFPFHRHSPVGIEESEPMTLRKVFENIKEELS
jgi:hypothetical protein